VSETNEERRTRLRPILDQLKAIPGNAVFLDLCELVLMHAAEVEGSIRWDHPRVVVFIRQRLTALRQAKRRGVILDAEQS
jgi:hypothetical protein